MEQILKKSIIDSIDVKNKMLDPKYLKPLYELGETMVSSIIKGGKVMLCGNGGSAADAQHLAAEFLVRLRPKINRNPLPAIALAQDTSTITACGNDFGFEKLFERNLSAIGRRGDILICISTSGKSENIKLAAQACNQNGIYCFGFLGNDGGTVKDFCNNYIIIPSNNTARIQEAHITIGHAVMEYVETELLKKEIIKLN